MFVVYRFGDRQSSGIAGGWGVCKIRYGYQNEEEKKICKSVGKNDNGV